MKHNLIRTLAAGTTALALSVSLLGPAHAADDVSKDAWYAQAVNYCLENSVMETFPDGNFEADSPLTRGMVASALYALADRPEVNLEPEEFDSGEEGQDQEEPDEPLEPQSPFTDVALSDPDANAIFWAWQEGLMSGYDNGCFGPDDPVTREQFSVILWQSLGRPLAQRRPPFTDRSEIASWSIDAVEWAWDVGLISGKPDGRFDPQGTATRAQGAVILMNYDLTFIHVPETSEPGTIRPNTYDNSKFVVKNGFLTYLGTEPYHVGIDVSSHQKDIDWAQVAAAGVDFAMIRVGYRGYVNPTLNKDTYFDYNIREALANGLEVGVYFFSQALSEEEALEEARLTLEWIDGYDITYPVVFDWEQVSTDSSRTKNADGQTTTRCAIAFCEAVEDAGYTAMTYGSPSKIYAGGLDLSQLQDYPFWLAHYTTGWVPTSFRYHYDMWQYSSTGSVPGIQGNVDLNLCLSQLSKG